MNAKKYLAMLAILLLTAIAAIAPVHAQTLPLVIEQVEFDDIEIYENQFNRLDVERGNSYEVEVKFTAFADVDNVELEACISGFEFNDIQRICDYTHVFDADDGVTYVKRLILNIPDDVEEDDYKLRLELSDRNSQRITMDYSLKLDVPRHALQIDDVILFPNQVEAGKAVFATVRVENKGEKVEEDVRVSVCVPQLGVCGVDYIEEIEEEDEEETEEIFLKIPSNAKSGTYDVEIEVQYDELHRKVATKRTIGVSGSKNDPDQPQLPKTVIQVPSTEDSASSTKAATFSLSVTNNDRNSKVYAVTVAGADDFDVTVSPSSAAIISGGSSQIFTLTATPRDGVQGTEVLSVAVKQGNEVLQTVPLTVKVVEEDASVSFLSAAKWTLGIALVLLVAILVISGLVLAVRRLSDDSEVSGAEAYY